MIVDDERLVRWSLRQKCEEWGYHVIDADAGEPALKLAQRESPDLVLLDVRMPDLTGIEVLDQLKKSGDARAVIMITADPQLDDVKAALKLGAYDFVGKPVDFDELRVTIKNALEATSLRTEVQTLRGEVRRGAGYNSVVSVSSKMTELMNFIRKVAGQRGHCAFLMGKAKAVLARISSRKPSTTKVRARTSHLSRDQLLGHTGDADGSRALWPRKGCIHGCQADEEGPVSKQPTAARSSSTKSANSLPCCKPNYCACSRTKSSGVWAASRICRWMCA